MERTGVQPAPEPPLAERLQPFLDSNPESSLREKNGRFFIARPWNDGTIRIKVSPENAGLIEALNQLILPSRFTAIWHSDSRDLEVIWGGIPKSKQEYGRNFKFHFDGRTYDCAFASASERLKKIVESAVAAAAESHTNFRNLILMKDVLGRMTQDPPDPVLNDYVLTSFWIRSIEVQDASLVRFVRHLNFYIRYFDRDTPCILIHENNPPDRTLEMPVQFVSGGFPPQMAALSLDDSLLALWENTVTAPDAFRRYLYSYQILEYAAFYFAQDELENQLKWIICAPESIADPQAAAKKALDIVAESKTNDDTRFEALLKGLVESETVWQQMQPNLAAFCKEILFEGGFALNAMVRQGCTIEDFRQSWLPAFPKSLRQIRHALVHSREQRSSKRIAPTGANYDLLRPWIPLISSAAMQVILRFRA